MSIGRKHELLERFFRDFDLAVLAHGPVRQRVRESLRAYGKLAQRKSPLQPTFVFWLVIAAVARRLSG